MYVTYQAPSVPEYPFAVFAIVFGAGAFAWIARK